MLTSSDASEMAIPQHIMDRLIANKLIEGKNGRTTVRPQEDEYGVPTAQSNYDADEGPELYACARHTVKTWRQRQERAWSRQKAHHEIAEEVEKEHERLTHVFMGDGGLDPKAWPRLLHKLQVLSEHNVRRQHALEKHRLSLEDWNTQPQLKAALYGVQQAVKHGEMPTLPQSSKKQAMMDQRVLIMPQRTLSKVEHAKGMAYEELAASIMNRMREMGVHAGTLLPQDLVMRDPDAEEEEEDEAGHERMLTRHETELRYDDHLASNLVADMRDFAHKTYKAHKFEAQVSRLAAGSTSAAQALSARLAEKEQQAQDDANEDSAGGAGDKQLKQRPSFTGSGASGASQVCSLFSMAASKVKRLSTASSSLVASSRRQSQARNKKVVLSPLVQAYHEACLDRGVYVSPDVAQQLHVSESSSEFKLVGVAMPDLVAASIADVLGPCTNLKTINFSRTVLNAGALAYLLPACRQMRLSTLQLVITDMASDCWPHLLEALQRPTISLSHPPSQWWRTLRNLSLSGNPLGDQGLACLSPAIVDLQALVQLDISQTGITDWSAPQVESLIRGCSGLQRLCLAHNQLGPLAGKALAGALPAASQLEHLDLSWNPLAGGVALVAWSLLAPRSQRQSKLSELLLRGVEMQSDDHLALAALLKWGHTWLPLTRLDISHNRLVGVPAQCLMRQLNALLPNIKKPPQLPPELLEASLAQAYPSANGTSADGNKRPSLSNSMRENSVCSRVSSMAQQSSLSRRLSSRMSIKDVVRQMQPPAPAESVRGLWTRPSTAQAASSPGTQEDDGSRKPSIYGARGSSFVNVPTPAPDQPNAAKAQPGKRELVVIALGCDVDNQGSTQGAHSSRSSGANVPQEAITPGAQRFVLNLAVQRPDHFLAQLLVEHELDARQRHYLNTPWQHVELNGVVYRAQGQDVIPFDVVFSGWGHPGVLPNTGTLVLEVLPLADEDSAWLKNPRLHFNATRNL